MDSIDGDFVASLLPDATDWPRIELVTGHADMPMASLESEVPVEPVFETARLREAAGPWTLRTMRPLSFSLFRQRFEIGVYGTFCRGADRQMAALSVTERASLGHRALFGKTHK